MEWEFGAPNRLIFGRGVFLRLGELCAPLGRRALLVTGKSSFRDGALFGQTIDMLGQKDVTVETVTVAGEPTVGMVDALTNAARRFEAEMVVAVGGGSVLDAAKAVSALLTNAAPGESVRDFLEGVGAGLEVSRAAAPMIAVPTTGGTGSEVTRNAVIRADDKTFKKSMRHALMRPAVALVDPMLSLTAPREVRAACGVDAATQLIEAFVSRRAHPLTDGFCREGMRLTRWALERVNLRQGDIEAHEAMALASMLSGMALDSAGLGAVHGLASPIGAMFDAPHGVVCGNLLPEICEANIRACRARARDDDDANATLHRFKEVAVVFQGDFPCEAEELADTLRVHREALKIPPLAHYGMRRAHIPAVLAGCRGGSMRTNPIPLTDETLAAILENLLPA